MRCCDLSFDWRWNDRRRLASLSPSSRMPKRPRQSGQSGQSRAVRQIGATMQFKEPDESVTCLTTRMCVSIAGTDVRLHTLDGRLLFPRLRLLHVSHDGLLPHLGEFLNLYPKLAVTIVFGRDGINSVAAIASTLLSLVRPIDPLRRKSGAVDFIVHARGQDLVDACRQHRKRKRPTDQGVDASNNGSDNGSDTGRRQRAWFGLDHALDLQLDSCPPRYGGKVCAALVQVVRHLPCPVRINLVSATEAATRAWIAALAASEDGCCRSTRLLSLAISPHPLDLPVCLMNALPRAPIRECSLELPPEEAVTYEWVAPLRTRDLLIAVANNPTLEVVTLRVRGDGAQCGTDYHELCTGALRAFFVELRLLRRSALRCVRLQLPVCTLPAEEAPGEETPVDQTEMLPDFAFWLPPLLRTFSMRPCSCPPRNRRRRSADSADSADFRVSDHGGWVHPFRAALLGRARSRATWAATAVCAAFWRANRGNYYRDCVLGLLPSILAAAVDCECDHRRDLLPIKKEVPTPSTTSADISDAKVAAAARAAQCDACATHDAPGVEWLGRLAASCFAVSVSNPATVLPLLATTTVDTNAATSVGSLAYRAPPVPDTTMVTTVMPPQALLSPQASLTTVGTLLHGNPNPNPNTNTNLNPPVIAPFGELVAVPWIHRWTLPGGLASLAVAKPQPPDRVITSMVKVEISETTSNTGQGPAVGLTPSGKPEEAKAQSEPSVKREKPEPMEDVSDRASNTPSHSTSDPSIPRDSNHIANHTSNHTSNPTANHTSSHNGNHIVKTSSSNCASRVGRRSVVPTILRDGRRLIRARRQCAVQLTSSEFCSKIWTDLASDTSMEIKTSQKVDQFMPPLSSASLMAPNSKLEVGEDDFSQWMHLNELLSSPSANLISHEQSPTRSSSFKLQNFTYDRVFVNA